MQSKNKLRGRTDNWQIYICSFWIMRFPCQGGMPCRNGGWELRSRKPLRIFNSRHWGPPYPKTTLENRYTNLGRSVAAEQRKIKGTQWTHGRAVVKGNIVPTTSLGTLCHQKAGEAQVVAPPRPQENKWSHCSMGSLQVGMPSPSMFSQNWQLAVIHIKDCFYQIPLDPANAPHFAFSVPAINWEAPMKCYHWQVLPQGKKNSLSICHWYVSSLLSPVHAKAGEATVLHYMDDVLVCALNNNILQHMLDLIGNVLIAAGFKLQEKKVQWISPWRYLGLEISNKMIRPPKLEIKNDLRTLVDLHQLCRSLKSVKLWQDITSKDLAPLFHLLKWEEDLSSPRVLTQETRQALEKVQVAMAFKQAHHCLPNLTFKFIMFGRLPHFHGLIFQWTKARGICS